MDLRYDESKVEKEAGKSSFTDRIKDFFEKEISVSDAKRYSSWVAMAAAGFILWEIIWLFI